MLPANMARFQLVRKPDWDMRLHKLWMKLKATQKGNDVCYRIDRDQCGVSRLQDVPFEGDVPTMKLTIKVKLKDRAGKSVAEGR